MYWFSFFMAETSTTIYQLIRFLPRDLILWWQLVAYFRRLLCHIGDPSTGLRSFKFKGYNCLHDFRHVACPDWHFMLVSLRLFLDINDDYLVSRTAFKIHHRNHNIKTLLFFWLLLLLSTYLCILKNTRPPRLQLLLLLKLLLCFFSYYEYLLYIVYLWWKLRFRLLFRRSHPCSGSYRSVENSPWQQLPSEWYLVCVKKKVCGLSVQLLPDLPRTLPSFCSRLTCSCGWSNLCEGYNHSLQRITEGGSSVSHGPLLHWSPPFP